MSNPAKPARLEVGGVSDGIADSQQSAPLLVTATEAARLLAVSPRTLWSMTNAGEVPHVRLRRSVRYSPADLVAWLDRLKSRPHT